MNISGPHPDWKAGFTCLRVFHTLSLTIDRCLERKNVIFLAKRRMQHHGELIWEIFWEEQVIAMIHVVLQGFDHFTGEATPMVLATLDISSGGDRKLERVMKCRVTSGTKRICVCQMMNALLELLPRNKSHSDTVLAPQAEAPQPKVNPPLVRDQADCSTGTG